MINFKTSPEDSALIELIVRRIIKSAFSKNYKHKFLDWEMDITACHANGNRLDLDGLLRTDDFNFAHDILGIMSHLNRETGKLEGFFVPRFSKGAENDNAH